MEGILRKSKTGGSVSFAAFTKDGDRCYVKAPGNPQQGRVPVTEYIVSAVGQLIGAPVCRVLPILIDDRFEGISISQDGNGNKVTLTRGIGSASMELPDAIEERALTHRSEDDNARRHAGVYALHDWCWGGDGQWLYCAADEYRTFSHDHGWYLPPEGPEWNEAQLLANVDVAHELVLDPIGLDIAEIERVAQALERVRREQLRDILGAVPAEWGIPIGDLEAAGYFLEKRAVAVAGRMRTIAAKTTPP